MEIGIAPSIGARRDNCHLSQKKNKNFLLHGENFDL